MKERPAKTEIRRDRLLTVGEVEKLTGVTRATLRDYDEKGLLCPRRSGEGTANNRKLYSLDDIERLKKIVALRAYEFSLREIRDLLDKRDADFFDALDLKLIDLRRREQRLRSLILFAKYVRITEGELFEGLVCGPQDLDLYADGARVAPLYAEAMARLRGYGDAERSALFAELDPIVEALAVPGEGRGFDALEGTLERFVAWWNAHVEPVDEAGYLGFWAVFEDDAVVASEVERVGGEPASGNLQMYLFFLWMKCIMIEERMLIDSVADAADSDVVLALARADELARSLGRKMGVRLPEDANAAPRKRDGLYELAHSVLSYVERILQDPELLGFLDGEGAVVLGKESVARAKEVVGLVLGRDEGREERGDEGYAGEPVQLHKDSSPFR